MKVRFKRGDRVRLYDPEIDAGETSEKGTVLYEEDGNDMYMVEVDQASEPGDDRIREVSSDQMYLLQDE